MSRKAAAAVLALAFGFGGPLALAQEADEAAALHKIRKQVIKLHGEGKYAEATAIAGRTLTLAEHVLGKDHPETLASVADLAELLYAQSRFGGSGLSAVMALDSGGMRTIHWPNIDQLRTSAKVVAI